MNQHLVAAYTRVVRDAHIRAVGTTPEDTFIRKHASATLESKDFGRMYALLADTAMCKVGGEGTAAQQFFHRLWQEPNWNPVFDRYTEIVKRACGVVALTEKQALGGNPVGDAAMGAVKSVGQAGNSAMDLLGTALLMSTTLGASAGALNWHLQRGLKEDDAENEELKAREQAYRALRRDIVAENGLPVRKAA